MVECRPRHHRCVIDRGANGIAVGIHQARMSLSGDLRVQKVAFALHQEEP
jgi:hypothetical protein